MNIRALNAAYDEWDAERTRINRNEPGASLAFEVSDAAAIDLLMQFAAAAFAIEHRSGHLVTELATQMHDEWPNFLRDRMHRSVALTTLRLLCGIELSVTPKGGEDDRPEEPKGWGSIIRAERRDVVGFEDVPFCRWQRSSENLWRSETVGSASDQLGWVARYDDLSNIEVLSRGPE